MKKKLNTTLGFYSPSFMRMHVNTDKDLQDIPKIKDDFTESIYLHEFIHFIQDITTSYGLANINVIADYMRFVNNHIVGLPAGSFSVPVQPIPGATDNVDLNLRLQNIYNGSGEASKVTITGVKKTQRRIKLPVGERLVPSIEVTCLNSKKKDKFNFGALCIVESMSYLIEKMCYPKAPNSPELPYHSAEKLVQFVYPDFGKNMLNVLALCDASLKSFHPGPFFYDLLIKMKSSKKTFASPEEIYVYAMFEHEPFTFEGVSDLRSVFIKSKEQAILQLKKYFNDPYFDPIAKWLEKMLENAATYRLRDDMFPLKIATGGPLAANAEFKKFLNNVGTPLITNRLYQATLYEPGRNNPSANYPIIWAMDQIHNIFWGIQRNCELKPLCHSSKVTTDANCDSSPWMRSTMEPYCPLGLLWRHWKLKDYAPV